MANTDKLEGTRLGDYILREKLTSGGMAHIYLGEDVKLQRRAAIKILTPDMAGDDEIMRDRFEREARAVGQLEHDNIVPIYQYGEHENLYFIAMRYIEGNDLADEMKKYKSRGEKMPIDRALYILEQVAAALDHAHKRGIIHRDVKPSNVLLGDNDKAVLSDFGLVLWENVDKTLGTAFGTPRYISPEQATDSQSAVPQSDIYSLAVIIYEIITGQVLFGGNTPMEVALAHITEQPTPPRAHDTNIPKNAQIEILKALQKDARKRHRTAQELIGALRQAYGLEAADGTKPPRAPAIAYDSHATQPLKPETQPLVEESAPSILDSWDSVGGVQPQQEVDTVIKAEEPAKKGGSPLPLLIGIVVMALIGVGASAALNIGPFANLNIGIGNPDATLTLRYNENYFAVVNTATDRTLNIENLRIVGDEGEEGADFGSELAPEECVFVHRANVQASAIPDAWGCDGAARRIESAQEIYWRAETEDETDFSVHDGDRRITTCRTSGRIVNNANDTACDVRWSDFTLIEDPAAE